MREEPDELPEEIMDELWALIDGPRDGFWSGVDRLCAQHSEREAEIRREAEAMLAEAESPRPEPPCGEFDDLPETMEAEVYAVVFGEATRGDSEAALQALCSRHPTFAPSIRQIATVLRAQVADMRRRLGAVWSLSHSPGRYESIEELGGGSFGSVSIVRDRLLGRRVALKTIHARHGLRLDQIEPRTVHRFLDEAQIAAQLRHPGIPLVHDLGIGPLGVPYYTMRYVRGQTLGAALEGLRGNLQGAVRLLVPVAEAVAYAHAQVVLHRDLKPDNIVVGRFGEVCVIDWGLARALQGWRVDPRDASVRTDRGVDLNSGGMGSEGYMAPEQRRGEFSPAGDVYSLAAILHLSLVGVPPPRLDREATFSLSRRAWKRDRWLAQICVRGLAPRLQDRYATMGEILADLKAYLADRPPAVSAPRLAEQLRARWRRLRRGLGRWRALAGRGSAPRASAANVATDAPSPRVIDRGGLTLVTRMADGGRRTGRSSSGERRRERQFEQRLRAIRELGTPTARYEDVGEVGSGGMGVVTSARDALLGRSIAVKRVRLGLETQDIRGRLLDEAQIAAQLDHPAILTVHEIAVDDGGAISVVMPMIDGVTLADLIRRAFDRMHTARILLRVAWGLAFAHHKGVVHRDIKPWNVLLGEHGDAYIGDWGMAILVGSPGRPQSRIRVSRGPSLEDGVDETVIDEEDGIVAGTLWYMSPEAARGEVRAIGPHSDVWSLGVVLYEIVAGRHPYQSQAQFHRDGFPNFQRLFDSLVIPSARSLNPAVPRSLAAVCTRALQLEPRDRYANAEEFAIALEAALA